MHRLLSAALALVTLTGCVANPDSTTLFQDVGMSFEPCNDAEIRWMNQKHQFMPALRICSSNHVAHYAWNPSGTHLYFDLTLTGNVLDASQDHKPLATLPIDQPTGHPAWINDQRLAVPIVPDPKDEQGRERIALYDIQQYVLELKRIPDITGITDLQRGDDPGTLYFTGLAEDGVRRIHKLDVNTGEVSRAFDFVDRVDTFTYTWQAGLLAVGRDETVTLFDAQGNERGAWAGRRGVVHPKGKWLALERDGEEVSVFYQRAWEDMSRRERELAEKKAAQLSEQFPEWYPKTVRLPTLAFVDLPSGAEGEAASFFGTRFQWYENTDYYGSFILWGYEGKQLNRNVMLGDLRMRIGAIEHGRELDDVKLLNRTPSPTDGSGEAAPPEDTPEVSPK